MTTMKIVLCVAALACVCDAAWVTTNVTDQGTYTGDAVNVVGQKLGVAWSNNGNVWYTTSTGADTTSWSESPVAVAAGNNQAATTTLDNGNVLVVSNVLLNNNLQVSRSSSSDATAFSAVETLAVGSASSIGRQQSLSILDGVPGLITAATQPSADLFFSQAQADGSGFSAPEAVASFEFTSRFAASAVNGRQALVYLNTFEGVRYRQRSATGWGTGGGVNIGIADGSNAAPYDLIDTASGPVVLWGKVPTAISLSTSSSRDGLSAADWSVEEIIAVPVITVNAGRVVIDPNTGAPVVIVAFRGFDQKPALAALRRDAPIGQAGTWSNFEVISSMDDVNVAFGTRGLTATINPAGAINVVYSASRAGAQWVRSSSWIPDGPTTLAPTTLAPTTVAATTVQPVGTTGAAAATTVAPVATTGASAGTTGAAAATTAAPVATTGASAGTTVAPGPTDAAGSTNAPVGTTVPATEAPTTLAPTTLAPTTLAPTTLASTTLAPTTLAPTRNTVAGGTFAPTTLAPTTAAPTTLSPTTLAATTLAPTSEAPTAAPPTAVPTPETPSPTAGAGAVSLSVVLVLLALVAF